MNCTIYEYDIPEMQLKKLSFCCFSSNRSWRLLSTFTFTLMHLADAFIQSDLQCIQAIHFFISMCVPWELNPWPFALLTQCSTTEPQEHVLKHTCWERSYTHVSKSIIVTVSISDKPAHKQHLKIKTLVDHFISQTVSFCIILQFFAIISCNIDRTVCY